MKENVSGCFFLNTVYKCTLNNNTNNKRQREVGPEREGRVVWRRDGRTRVNGSGPDRVEGGDGRPHRPVFLRTEHSRPGNQPPTPCEIAHVAYL